jgi:hypothetical protein
MATKKCMSCGGSMAKMKTYAKGGSTTNKLNSPKGFAKPQMGGSNTEKGIYGVPNAGPTGNNLSGTYSYKKGGAVKKMAKGGSAFGMLSVKAGVDKNPKPTAADRIAGAKMNKKKMGGITKKK